MTHTLAQKLKVTLDLIETSRLAWDNVGPSLRGVIVSCLYIIVSVLYILDHEMCFINFKSLLSDHKLFNVNQYEFSYLYLQPCGGQTETSTLIFRLYVLYRPRGCTLFL